MFLYIYLWKICGYLRWDLCQADWFASVERGNIGMFRYHGSRDRGHLRERSGYAVICVEVFVPILKDHEWALSDTNFLGYADSLFVKIGDHSWSK